MATKDLGIILKWMQSGQGNLKQAEQQVAGLDKSVKKLAVALGAYGLGRATTSFLKDSALMAAQSKVAQTAFDSLSGSSQQAQKNLEAMGRATRGLASETEQMQIASQLLGLRVAETDEELERMVYAARRLGATFRGLGTADAANEFAILMTNMSYLRLDSFGISSQRVKQRVDELTRSTKELSQEQAFFQATMEEATNTLNRLGDEQDTLLTDIQELDAAWANFKTEFGELMSDGGVIGAFTDIANALSEGAQAWQGIRDQYKTVQTYGAASRTGGKGPDVPKWLETAIRATPIIMPGAGVAKAALTSYQAYQSDFLRGLGVSSGLIDMTPEQGAALKWAQLTGGVGQRPGGGEVSLAGIGAPGGATGKEITTEMLADFQEYLQDTVDTEREYGSERARLVEEYGQRMAQAEADFARSRDRSLRDFHRQEQRAEQAYNRQRMQLAERYGVETQRMEEDHQRRMGQMRQDYNLRQEDAIADRDAIAYLRNRRQYQVERDRAEGDYSVQAERRSEDYARQLEDMAEQFTLQRDQRLADFEMRRADELEDFQYRQQQEAAAHQLALQELQQAKANELAELQSAYVDEEGELTSHMSAMKSIQAQGFKDMEAAFSAFWAGAALRGLSGGLSGAQVNNSFTINEAGNAGLTANAIERKIANSIEIVERGY